VVIAFRINERVGAGFQADGTFEFFLKKFLEGCMDGGQCEDHDEKKKMMLVIGNMICGWVCVCVFTSLLFWQAALQLRGALRAFGGHLF
jgi:hypothetical protein